jgi:Tol biopolymer transport system component
MYVSHSNTATPTDGSSYQPSISADGRYVAFESFASNLVAQDTNACPSNYNGNCFDVFVWDRLTTVITRASVATDGTQANNDSLHARLSPNGRYVAFASWATNLVNGQGAGLYIRDLQTHQTTFVATSHYGDFDAAFSEDGRYVAFYSSDALVSGDTNYADDVFLYDQQTTVITRVSVSTEGAQGNGNSTASVAISSDGRYVAFRSDATNLVLSDTNAYVACDQYDTGAPANCPDAFAHDVQTGETTRVSVASDGTQGNHYTFGLSISGDGRFVAFESFANTLVLSDTNNAGDIFVHDRFGGPLPWSISYIYLPLIRR